jgi:hypothetical protein
MFEEFFYIMQYKKQKTGEWASPRQKKNTDISAGVKKRKVKS